MPYSKNCLSASHADIQLRMILFLLIFPLLTGAYGQSSRTHYPIGSQVYRLPLQKKNITLIAPKIYEKRILRYDPNTEEAIYYDPRPQVVLLDSRSGKYALKWIGYDGKEKTVIYQRPDRIDAIVSASVSSLASGRFLYVYRIDNLASSGQQLSDFAIQTFASDVRALKDHSGFVGQMSNNRTMKKGTWIFFGSSYIGPSVSPGRSVELRLESLAPPGLVECSVTGGVFGMKGAGEEMPQELENILPGYEIWPRGYTVGPVDNLKSLSRTEHCKYLLEGLSRFQSLGWMKSGVRRRYYEALMSNNVAEMLKQADQDLSSGQITPEVYDMIRAVR